MGKGRLKGRCNHDWQPHLLLPHLRFNEVSQLLSGEFVAFEIRGQLSVAVDNHGVQRVCQ
jgi:hypothetical protein